MNFQSPGCVKQMPMLPFHYSILLVCMNHAFFVNNSMLAKQRMALGFDYFSPTVRSNVFRLSLEMVDDVVNERFKQNKHLIFGMK